MSAHIQALLEVVLRFDRVSRMFKSAYLETCEVPFEQGILLGRFVASRGAAHLEISSKLERFFQYLL